MLKIKWLCLDLHQLSNLPILSSNLFSSPQELCDTEAAAFSSQSCGLVIDEIGKLAMQRQQEIRENLDTNHLVPVSVFMIPKADVWGSNACSLQHYSLPAVTPIHATARSEPGPLLEAGYYTEPGIVLCS